MKPKIQVHIPQPCHENWNNMLPVDKGRFCQSCSKQVIDFSVMTDNEIINHLTKSSGHLCGRFAETQLQRPLQPTTINKKQSWWIALTMPLLLLFDKAGAQKKVCNKPKELISNNQQNPLTGIVSMDFFQNKLKGDTIIQEPNYRSITGKVVDENYTPIAGASIVIKGTNQGTSSNRVGTFTINNLNKTSLDSITLVTSCVGYAIAETSVSSATINDSINIKIIQLQPQLSGEVVVVGGYISSHKRKKIDTIQTFIRKAFHQEAFKVFPNPALSGAQIKVDVKKAGAYSIQLIDSRSNFITAIPFDAVAGSTVTTFTMPSNIATGIYYIVVRNEQTKNQYSDKILIQ